ncbi:UNVERIFIED_CONTAM: hypothetical protein Sindi_1277700 [Sesamum indicum]
MWPALREVIATANGFFFFQFKTLIDMEDVIEGGPWLFQGQPIVLQKWKLGMAMRKLQHKHVPIWIKLRHLPMEYWTIDGLSTVASGVGRPLYPDAITRACTRLDFARVCVMIDVAQTLPKHIIVMTPDENGGETPCKVDVEYEWLPPKCTNCMILGHMTKDCPLNKIHKPSKPPVAVYVAKTNTPLPKPNNEKSRKPMRQTMVDIPRREEGEVLRERKPDKHGDRVWNVRGLNKRDHQLALKDLVSEFRLHFLGILETRIQQNNIMHIQSYLLPQWNWFTDYNSIGNRIWLAWDENFIDVHVLDLGDQFVHCRITSRAVNETVFVTIVYGASEVIDRRILWTTLETLAQQCLDIPWLVGGDFNAVREFNENIWHHEVVGIPMYAVTRKLKALKPVFRLQRRNKGDLTLNVQLAKSFLDEAQQLVSSDRQNELYLLLEHWYRIIYAKAAKLEQIMLQQRAKMQWMKDGDQCSRVFFRKIAQRRVMRRILQINDENGTTHTDQGEVAHEFVSYFQNLLGGTRRQFTVDIRYLRPWARHCITDEEASHLLLPFSPDDVKQAMFDIAEDKAPGPDGYSSGFFKAAWPVVGEEVTRAVLDFFTTGKLLKQINSTILTLIPKELFSGYNQMRLPPRCALKVDIRKAYDTVEWDFLLAVLQLFGFPAKFTRWIEECVSTRSFSIGLNGKPHGFFTGARGLRQGDPLSPYLFVLVMEALHLGFLQ